MTDVASECVLHNLGTLRVLETVSRCVAPSRNRRIVSNNLISPQIASDDSKFFACVLKSGGYGTPSPKSGDTGTRRTHDAYAKGCF